MSALPTQVVVDDDLMEYELDTNHGQWKPWKPPQTVCEKGEKNDCIFIRDTPRPAPKTMFLATTSSSPSAFAQPVTPGQYDSQCFGCKREKMFIVCIGLGGTFVYHFLSFYFPGPHLLPVVP